MPSPNHGKVMTLCRRQKLDMDSDPAATSSMFVLFGLRLTRRWNQTGQKLAGEPDIAKTFFHNHPNIMWIAVIATYLCSVTTMSRRQYGRRSSVDLPSIMPLILGLVAFTFKVAYTAAEAPELLRGFPPVLLIQVAKVSLLAQARMVFLGCFIVLVYEATVHWRLARTKRKRTTKEGRYTTGSLPMLLV